MAGDRDDDLARTATALPGESASAPALPAEAIGATLGRYRLERELGTGGMGVVHAAFDPDLERRIALKVLRTQATGTEAKDRLLREARAMARLAHPNVVTVHEVGTANGRDYVAMELIAGETLAEWLRRVDRTPAAIIEAFVGAGRGLAAAHAAGIVHRDFKPHNVLRGRDGRIVVTDFGLARAAQPDLSVPLATTLPVSGTANATTTPGSLDGITVTGSVLGTPAYMAPEQWSGGVVTPATDQFAYCVALWEALVGERPYRGPTVEELRAQVARGPQALDIAKLPRRLRKILARGLDPDPARRWPSMDALLARLVRAERRPGVALALAGGTLAVVGIAYAIHAASRPDAPPACPDPALDPAVIWPATARAENATQYDAATAVDTDVGMWRSLRATACTADPAVRGPRLACFDNVMSRLAIVARAVRVYHGAQAIDAGAWLIDPRVCELAQPPRLVSATPELAAVITSALVQTATPAPLTDAAATQLVHAAGTDPCSSALAHVLAASARKSAAVRSRDLDEAQQDAERCGDDRIGAETALAVAQQSLEFEWLGSTVTTKVRLAEVAAQRVSQPDLVGALALLRVTVAKRADNADEVIARCKIAIDGFAARGRLRPETIAQLDLLDVQVATHRLDKDALAGVSGKLAALRARAVRQLGPADPAVRAIDGHAAHWAYVHGDLAGAHKLMNLLERTLPNDPARAIAGSVVDDAGKPVAGARVTAGNHLDGDALTAVISSSDRDSMRSVTTGDDGRFTIPDAPDRGTVIAELGDRRSSPSEIAGEVKLVLEPTVSVEGHIDLAGESPENVIVVAKDLARPMTTRYATIGPVAPDGRFTIGGLPRDHQVRILVAVTKMAQDESVMAGTTVTLRGDVTRGVALSIAASKRVVTVLVRSTVNARLANAEVGVLPGKVPSMTAAELNAQFHGGTFTYARQLEGEHAPKQVVGTARAGDLYATIADIPAGVASACAIALPELNDDEAGRKLNANLDKLPMICIAIPEHTDVVTIEVPPLPRLD